MVFLPLCGLAGDLEVATRLSWSSAAQPILHVLVRNTGKQLRDVNVVVPQALACDGKPIAADPDHYRAFIDLTNWHAASTNGVVQPGSWMHRSYPLALEAPLKPPCEVEYEVWDKETLEAVESGKVTVPVEPVRGTIADFDSPPVSTNVVVEEDRDYPGLLIARVLVQNQSERDLVLYEDERNIECRDGGKAVWPLLDGVLQGEDSGPASVGAGKWVVFVNAIRLEDPSRGESCTANFRIAGLHESGLRKEVSRVSTTLIPRGYVERPWRHKR